jgi:hypothetical protein
LETIGKSHEHFGELSALAVIGQLPPEEYRELKAHLELCAACREEHAALTHLQLFELPLAHPVDNSEAGKAVLAGASNPCEHGEWSVASHVGRVQGEARRWSTMWRNAWRFLGSQPAPSNATFLALFLAISVIVVGMYQHQKLDNVRDTEVARLRTQVQDFSRASTNKPTALAPRVEENDSHETPVHVPAAIPVDKDDHANLLARNNNLKSQLQSASDEMQALKDQASSSAIKEDQLATRLAETESALANIKSELQASREVHAQDAAELRKQQERAQQMEERLAAATNSIDRDRQWLAADLDIRNLMGARNLRIVDVFDVDSKGKTRKPFGRVFFTEGKSLIFYAFDMPTGRSGLQSAAYQAWGSEGSVERGVRSLGIFYQDDQKASRWVLKFDDPNTLAEIDSVFVTVEPPGGSKKPTGSAFLTAYLKASLNHP